MVLLIVEKVFMFSIQMVRTTIGLDHYSQRETDRNLLSCTFMTLGMR